MNQHVEIVKRLSKQKIIAEILDSLHLRLPKTLKYHVADHTLDVLNEVILFASVDSLKDREMELLAIGAAYHDAGFLESVKENEALGARMAVEAMQKDGSYTSAEVLQVKTIILDTQLKMGLTGPKQISTSFLSNYLLDADVSNLGRDDFFDKAELVRNEVGVIDEKTFYEGVLKFITCHSWYSPAANSMRNEKKQKNIQELKARLSRL